MSTYYILRYHVVDDYVTKRTPYRPEHLALTDEFAKSGFLLLGGAVGDPPDSAVLVFRCLLHEIERFVELDPYVQNGVVERYTIQPWHVVTGVVNSSYLVGSSNV